MPEINERIRQTAPQYVAVAATREADAHGLAGVIQLGWGFQRVRQRKPHDSKRLRTHDVACARESVVRRKACRAWCALCTTELKD